MPDPRDHLPKAFAESSILELFDELPIPRPNTIRQLQVTAAFHCIYVLTYSDHDDSLGLWLHESGYGGAHSSSTDLVLRISGDHIPKIKTENEAAVLSWVRSNTDIPVPSVLAFDSTSNNPLGSEYILMTRELGDCLADVYKSIDMVTLVDHIIDVQVQLHSTSWGHIGGLRLSGTNIRAGPVVEETFWFVPDILRYWGANESFQTMNISGPFTTYVQYVSAHVRKYMHAMKVHPSLAFMLDTLPVLESFLENLAANATILNDVKLRLAHKDLHYANILVDTSTGQITSILDWEFAGVVPFTRWDPSRAFLWNAIESDEARAEKGRKLDLYYQRAKKRGYSYLIEDTLFTSPQQENMQLAVNYLRAIIEVFPMEERPDAVHGWKQAMLEAISKIT